MNCSNRLLPALISLCLVGCADVPLLKDLGMGGQPKRGRLGISVCFENNQDVVKDIAEDSPLRKSPLRVGDVIVAYDDIPVNTPSAFLNFREHLYASPRRPIKLRIRNGATAEQDIISKISAAGPRGDFDPIGLKLAALLGLGHKIMVVVIIEDVRNTFPYGRHIHDAPPN